jgi:hypothetical protein
MGALMRSLATRLTAIRAATDKDVRPAAVKLLPTEARQVAVETELDLAGPAEALHSADGYDFEQPTKVGLADGNAGACHLRSQALTIEGGTSMVVRNALADPALELPRDPTWACHGATSLGRPPPPEEGPDESDEGKHRPEPQVHVRVQVESLALAPRGAERGE